MTSSVTLDVPQEKQESFSFEDRNKASQQSATDPSLSSVQSNKPCLQLKGSLVPMTALELIHFDEDQFKQDLEAKTSQAPDFFENLPVIISLEKLEGHEHLPFDEIIKICASYSIKVVAIRGGSETQQAYAKKAGLGLLAKQKEKPQFTEPATEPTPEPEAAAAEPAPVEETAEAPAVETVEVIKTVVEKERQVSKVIHHPIRSGQQVYAADGDLIILASVSAGAEILADGNIHVYGALRGRALAGVKGDTSARIFCQSLSAELVSIAGQYKISEDLDKKAINKAAQVFLDDDSLRCEPLEL